MQVNESYLTKLYEDLKIEFKNTEKKDFSSFQGLSQCKTRKGCFVYGKLVTVVKLLED